MIYVASMLAGAVTSLFFDWIFVFAVSVGFFLIASAICVYEGAGWWTLGKIWLALASFHLSYFCVGLLAFGLRVRLARREGGVPQPERND